MMSKEQMMDNIIKKYGFESEWTVWFCKLAEELTKEQLIDSYAILMYGVTGTKDNEEEE